MSETGGVTGEINRAARCAVATRIAIPTDNLVHSRVQISVVVAGDCSDLPVCEAIWALRDEMEAER